MAASKEEREQIEMKKDVEYIKKTVEGLNSKWDAWNQSDHQRGERIQIAINLASDATKAVANIIEAVEHNTAFRIQSQTIIGVAKYLVPASTVASVIALILQVR